MNLSNSAAILISGLTGSRERKSNRAHSLSAEVTRLFDQFRSPLFRYVLSLGLGTGDAEEVIQETFLALFQHLSQGKPRTNLRAWIFQVAHNLAVDMRTRRPAVAETADGFDWLDPSPTPEDQAVALQREQRLSAVVHALPEQERACLALRAEGLRYREIARILGISLGSVSGSLKRSLEKLARVYER